MKKDNAVNQEVKATATEKRARAKRENAKELAHRYITYLINENKSYEPYEIETVVVAFMAVGLLTGVEGFNIISSVNKESKGEKEA